MAFLDPSNIPLPEEVNRIHTNSDVDKSRLSQHHTLGTSATQASPGNHNHDGVTSVKIKASDIIGDIGANGYYGAFSDYTDQYSGGATTYGTAVPDTAAPMRFTTTDEANGMSIVSQSRITFQYSGVYNIQWSGQFESNAVAPHDVSVWLRKNGGSAVVGSNGLVGVPQRKDVNDVSHIIAGWNFVFSVMAGDYYEFMWSTDSIDVSIQTYPVSTVPTRPSTASLVLTVTQVMNNALPSGTLAVVSPITNTGTSANAVVGLDQTALSITQSQVSGLVSALAGKANLAGGNAFTGTQTITSTAAGEFPLSIISASGQTASTFRVRNSANNADLMSIDSSGQIRTPTLLNPNSFNNSRLQMQNTGVFIDTGITTNVPLAVRGASGQTENLQVWQSNAGSNLARISQTGSIGTNGNLAVGNIGITNTNQFQVTATAATQIGAVIRGAASQTGDFFQTQTSTGTVLGGRNANGQIYTGSTTPSTYVVGGTPTGASGTGSIATITFGSPTMLAVGDLIQVSGFTTAVGTYNTTGFAVVTAVSNTPTFFVSYASTGVGTPSVIGQVATVPQSSVVARSAGTIGQVVRGTLGQTADVFQIQRFDGVPFVVTNASYQMGFGSRVTVGTTAISTAGLMTVIAQLATQIPAVIRGAASQSANLLELQNSAGTIQASIDANGMATLLRGNFRGAVYGTGTYYGAVNVLQESGGHGVVIQGRDSQTTDVLRIRMGATPGANNDALIVQNSAGTTLAKITSAGILRASQILSLNGLASMGEFNNGAIYEFVRATAASYSPGANRATMYFRDGTTAGTLKLVVRAGAAGAETTILDNIPQ